MKHVQVGLLVGMVVFAFLLITAGLAAIIGLLPTVIIILIAVTAGALAGIIDYITEEA